LRFTGTLTCQVFFRSVGFRMRNRGRVSGLQAALSGSNPKAPGFAGGYLLNPSPVTSGPPSIAGDAARTRHRLPLAASRARSLTPEAQSTFAAIDFLSVADKANEATRLQPPKDPEKKLRLRVRPSHQLLTDFGIPSPLRFVEDDDVFGWPRSVCMLFQIAEEVLDRRVSLVLSFGLRTPRTITESRRSVGRGSE
jgi:hypothetical protein